MEQKQSLNFIEQIIEQDLEENKNEGRVHTRFPPEPNGYLHIGHAKAITLNFGIAQKYKGKCNLRFDDTNPEKEESIYVDSIKEDIRWLGFDWEDREYYASDYFPQLYEYAVKLVKKGKAYVDDQSMEEIAATRGTPTRPGVESPYRERPVTESLTLLEKMKAGEFEEGERVLRAKIDMASPNMHMRDPVLYRIKKVPHHRTGSNWSIYPTYDFAHGQSDSIEGVTHSLCSLEFEVHRPLYDWLCEALEIFHPQQIEFARLNLNYTIMSKRKLLQLVKDGYVQGWDDPRMPTLSGMRRRGYTAEAIRDFCDRVGVAKRNNIIDIALLEHTVREHLNVTAPRAFAVMDPVKLIIDNYPDHQEENLPAVLNPEDPQAGQRMLPFGKEILIDRSDFMEDPPKKYFRLGPDRMVRLKYAYIIKCTEYITDDSGKVSEIHAEYYPESKSGEDQSGLKVKGTIHWLMQKYAVQVEVRLYDRLFLDENPAEKENFLESINPDSLSVVSDALVEPSLKDAKPGQIFQFERNGYFCIDKNSSENHLIFNRTVTLRDSWSKIKEKTTG